MTTWRTLASLTLSTLIGCGGSAPAPRPTAVDACPPQLDGADVFAREHVKGTFVLRDEATGCTRATDIALADRGYRPMSTFKLPNTIIGLETGVIGGESHPFRWDKKVRPMEAWNTDMTLPDALKVSCVPCFQEVARGVGEGRMTSWLARFDYGNRDISGPIDAFWLTGPLRITPRQQTTFIHRLDAGELGAKAAHVEMVWKMLEIERTPELVWRGKTGLGTQDGHVIGWLVGSAERAGRKVVFALVVEGETDGEAEMQRVVPMRKKIARELLMR